LIAPDLIYPEIGNTLWRKYRLKELSASEVKEILESVISLPIKIEPSKPFIPLAVELSVMYNVSVYDAIYVSLAKIYETRLLTSDKKIVKVIEKTPLVNNIEWLGLT
jgi:predicted nucleic acid-binding protein